MNVKILLLLCAGLALVVWMQRKPSPPPAAPVIVQDTAEHVTENYGEVTQGPAPVQTAAPAAATDKTPAQPKKQPAYDPTRPGQILVQ